MPLFVSLSLLFGLAFAMPNATLGQLQGGDCTEALGQRPENETERLALARCQLESDNPTSALTHLSAVTDPAWRPYRLLLEGEAFLLAGRPGAAVEPLTQARPPGPAGERARMLLGRALIESGDTEQGRSVLSAMLTGDFAERGRPATPGGADPAEVRFWLAQGALKRGDLAAAVPAFERVWTWHPAHPRGAEAEVLLKQLGKDPSRTNTPEDRKRIEERIRTLDQLHLATEALILRDKLGGMGPRTEARAAFSARDYARAARIWSAISDLKPSEKFDLALATSRAGDYPGAARLYRALFSAHPSTPEADTASFKVAYLSYDAGDLPAAVPLFREHLARYPASRHADEARWFLAWSLVRLEDPAASSALGELVAKHPRSDLAPGGRYWQARLADLAGDKPKAQAGYAEVLKGWPASGYAWFAATRLGKRYPARNPNPAPPSLPSPTGSLASNVHYQRGSALAAVGLDAWARAELDLSTPAATTPEDRLALAHVRVVAGDYAAARSGLPGGCPSPSNPNPATMAVCWPRPLGNTGQTLAGRVGLDPNLPYAIMMAESGMRPEVTSPVGARGLMQLMPAVAARLEPDRRPDPDRLYSPGVNARLGILELSRLHTMFRGRLNGSSLPAVIAGYNGGPEAVERWLSASATPQEFDRWAEDISFTETRRYVKRVLGYLQTWRQVYGDPA